MYYVLMIPKTDCRRKYKNSNLNEFQSILLSGESIIGKWAMGSILDNIVQASLRSLCCNRERDEKLIFFRPSSQQPSSPPRLEASYSCMAAVVDHLRVHKSYFESFSFQSALGQPSQESFNVKFLSQLLFQQLKIL